MMHTNDNDIDWDKLMEVLDGNATPDILNEAELDMLASAREMKARLRADEFSAEEGWERFAAERQRRAGRRIVLIRQIAATLLVLAVGAGAWLMTSRHKVHNTPELATALPSGSVILKRPGGSYTLGKDSQVIQQTGASLVKADAATVTYSKSSATGIPAGSDTLDVPRGRQFGLQLSDGTRVTLNAASTLIYPSLFNGDTREVYVTGEAYFDIAPDAAHPFIVHTGDVTMKVLGTAFNINNYGAGITTTLTSGKLRVSNSRESITLAPGEQSVSSGSESLHKQAVTDLRRFTAWKDGDVYFDDTPLSEIAKELSLSYDYEIIFDDAAAANTRFTLDTRRPVHLQDVLNLISQSVHAIKFKTEGKTIHVMMNEDK